MSTILASIGHTALVELKRVVPANCARIAVKLESQNPTGIMKDRMAMATISRAESDGRLKRGDTVIEYTGGSTGTSLAMVCAAKGYRFGIEISKHELLRRLNGGTEFIGAEVLKAASGAALHPQLLRFAISELKYVNRFLA